MTSAHDLQKAAWLRVPGIIHGPDGFQWEKHRILPKEAAKASDETRNPLLSTALRTRDMGRPGPGGAVCSDRDRLQQRLSRAETSQHPSAVTAQCDARSPCCPLSAMPETQGSESDEHGSGQQKHTETRGFPTTVHNPLEDKMETTFYLHSSKNHTAFKSSLRPDASKTYMTILMKRQTSVPPDHTRRDRRPLPHPP